VRISTQLRIITRVTIVAIVILIPVLVWSFVEFNRAKIEDSLVEDLQDNYFQRASFRDQYVLHREVRLLEQWRKSRNETNDLQAKAKATFQRSQDLRVLERFIQSIEHTEQLFERIVANTQAMNAAGANKSVYEEFDKRLYSQLLMMSIDVRAALTTLKRSTESHVESSYRALTIITALFGFTLALAVIVAAQQMDRMVRRRLLPLHTGVATVAEGNLGYRITMDGSDEFTDLAVAINSMTVKLQSITRNLEDSNQHLTITKELAEAANRAKSTFLSTMSHELRTPLNGMMGMTDLALRRATDPQQIDFLNKAVASARRLLGVINDILDISKIEAERLTLEEHDFVLDELMENLTNTIGQKVTDKGLRLSIELPPDSARLYLHGDPMRVGQILLNFTANAVKFTKTGSITVRTTLSEESPADLRLRFEVQDSGIGIPVDDQKRLFSAFEQVDGSTTRKYGGTGLGLAISKRLAKLMGGEVGVISQSGEGSTFWFDVRLSKAHTPRSAASPAPTLASDSAESRLKASFAGRRVLLAEDEPTNRDISRLLLEDVGITVDLAEDGLEAVTMAKRTRYALILMDMQMPNLNGGDATRIIRTLPGYSHTPILAMTANAFEHDREVCLDAGMNDHIAKPFDPETLFETLLRWISVASDRAIAHNGSLCSTIVLEQLAI